MFTVSDMAEHNKSISSGTF